ncbi:hypothetical protein D9V41_13545 [Aeromicrobium phragmitis]|uniref:Polyhydroxybutyrate depolymerase n=1 Tax=Aeromicrobium phragmitis TaxID=2478914 RepID=A0A3L8PIV2_9ACTN|nr:hypothetical protein [Aeromicrobium phragmitis]RLV55104.1 hypothetical protein D9V41_13545 [Aeromicrobium phragmitis]
MLRRILMAVGLVLVTSGCVEEPSPAPTPSAAPSAESPGHRSGGCRVPATGTSAHTLDIAGAQRQFVIDVPDGFTGERLPVVYFIHGLGGEATSSMAYTGFPEYGEAHGFITVAPQALGSLPRWDFTTGPEVAGSDFDYLRQLTEHVAATWCGDTDRQYLTGFSNGSAMTFAAACFGGVDFAAYGSVAAAGYLPDRCAEAPAASIIYAHGTADPTVPFEGGDTVIQRVAPADQVLQQWAAHNACGSAREEQVAADVRLTAWDGCADDSRIAFYVIDGGGHQWPGGAAAPGLGRASGSINITALMVDFFGLSGAESG